MIDSKSVTEMRRNSVLKYSFFTKNVQGFNIRLIADRKRQKCNALRTFISFWTFIVSYRPAFDTLNETDQQ
jgi:hypothetical protein